MVCLLFQNSIMKDLESSLGHFLYYIMFEQIPTDTKLYKMLAKAWLTGNQNCFQ